MKKTKKMQPGCLYLFEGESSSSSCFIQSEADAKSFIILANQYLKDFLKIHEYSLNKDSWLMIVSIRSREKILKSYKARRDRSNTCNRLNDHTEIWKIISEQMRQFLKQYVSLANKRSGREGSLVKGPYKRSFFESIKEAQLHVKKLRNQLIKREQTLKKYRGRKKFYKIAKKKIKGNLYLCSLWKTNKNGINSYLYKMKIQFSNLIELSNLMSSKLVLKTIKMHI